jgi:predicted Abi (CAAX) family protease
MKMWQTRSDAVERRPVHCPPGSKILNGVSWLLKVTPAGVSISQIAPLANTIIVMLPLLDAAQYGRVLHVAALAALDLILDVLYMPTGLVILVIFLLILGFRRSVVLRWALATLSVFLTLLGTQCLNITMYR